MSRVIRDVLRAIVRGRAPVRFDDPVRTEPVSRTFGFDRGTPIDRYYIAKFVAGAAIRGEVVEFGAATYAPGARVISVEPGPGVDLVADLTGPVPEAIADCVICTQTLNMIFDLNAAIAGLRRMLKPGGTLLVTVPGISQISRYDMERWGEYWRFTEASLRKLFGDAAVITAYGNRAAATAFLDGIAVEDLPDRRVLDVRDPDYPVTLGVIAR